MQPQSHKKQRRREVWMGLITLLAAFSYVASLLLDFNFVSPYATIQEDLTYLSNHLQNKQNLQRREKKQRKNRLKGLLLEQRIF